jgi:hypothetical protein
MRSRKRLTRKQSFKKFKRGAKVNKKNTPHKSSRGGIML